jgi:hypothetical protein
MTPEERRQEWKELSPVRTVTEPRRNAGLFDPRTEHA